MVRSAFTAALLSSSVLIAGCATTPEAAPAGPPDYTALATHPSAQAGLYGGCMGQAIANGAYGRFSDGDSTLLLFTCQDAPARAFYNGLAERSAAVNSEVQAQGRTFRSTETVQRNLIGVDYCSTDGAGDYECVITLNAGSFLAE